MDSAATDGWQEWVDERMRTTLHQLAAEAELRAAKRAAAASEQNHRELWEGVHQSLRHFRRAETRASLVNALLDSIAPHTGRAAVFSLDTSDAAEQARAEAQRNLGAETITFPLVEAAAFVAVLETRDSVVAAATAQEISPALIGLLEDYTAGKVYLFPLLVRQQTTAILFAADTTRPAGVEALAEAAAMRLEALSSIGGQAGSVPRDKQPGSATELVQLNGEPKKTVKAWDELSEAEQRIHLRAQRLARVKVAELRLAHMEKVKRGLVRTDVYGELQPEVDGLRAQFREEFLTAHPTMVDYLHLELVRSLANHDERLLGPQYPGPLV
jgi:hypothetical protein